MDQDKIALEEGEISDASESDYTPLERPPNFSSSAQPNARFPVILDSDSDNDSDQSTNDTDSDSDHNRNQCKKPRIKLKLKPQRRTAGERRYDIWLTRAQDDVLAETLNCCDVSKKDRSRDVESYDFCPVFLGKKNKRTIDDRRNPNVRLEPRSDNSDTLLKGASRTILDLNVNCESYAEDIAKDMANKLCEEKEDLILNVVNVIGKEKSFEFFNETKRIEADGGMLIMNQTRRRTPGGVFLFLIRHDNSITQEQKHNIFEKEKEKNKNVTKKTLKQKYEKLKEEIASSRNKILPDLMTRAELSIKRENKSRNETEENVVVNPPPTPETDHFDNSGDGMDDCIRKIESYDDDFLDLGASHQMDMF